MPLPYTRSEVKDRARENWRGACNVTLPTFTSGFDKLNAAAIRHDIQHAAGMGFWGTLVASECGTTTDEYIEFLEIAADAAPKDFRLVAHLGFTTTAEMYRVAKAAEAIGVEAALPAFPTDFRAKSAEDIVAFTRELSEQTDLALILFAVMTWGYRALGPEGFPHDAIVEATKIDTVAAVKYEAGPPGILTGLADVLKRCGDQALIQCPMESTAPALVEWYGMQWMGTSGYESFGDRVPRFFDLLHEGRWEEGMEIYWSYQALREAKGAITATTVGSNLIHRPMWKYLGWLHGFNGGELRQPQMRLHPRQMAQLRSAAVASGYDLPSDDSGFHEGRHSA
jgi:dihydrodipicolinate synthase/N-acetylneuraminate lyase